jgi:hypothetical protein
MEQGFLLEFTDHGVAHPTKWVEGKPEKGWFGTVKRKGKAEHTVESYRCGKCYLVENYAPPSKAS